MSDIGKLRTTAITFLYLDFVPTSYLPYVQHPFTNSYYVGKNDENGDWQVFNLLNEKDANIWRETLKQKILQGGVDTIFQMLNPAFILTFLKWTKDSIVPEDMGRILNKYWTGIEYINTDPDVNGMTILSFFRKADSKTLMTKEEQEVICNLPEQVKIYRGVTSFNKKYKKALSWTLDRKKAEWFANRFNTGTGEVWTLTVPKKKILCCFLRRNENEVIVDLYRQQYKIEVEKSN